MANRVLDEKLGKVLGEFVEMMKGMYGDGLVSLYVFGEGAVEPPGGGRQAVKLLAVMAEVGPEELRRYAGVYLKWNKKGVPAPLMMTEGVLDASTDVFPIEFLEMKEAHVLLYGRDVLAKLEIGLENLRRQCEEQVKGKLIHLQQAYMEACGDRKALAALMASSIEPFIEIMRNLIRINKDAAHLDRETIIRESCGLLGLDESPFAEAYGIRRTGETPSKEELESLFARYLTEVKLMAEKVDKMGATPPCPT
jgi:hypothetical protein